MARTSREEVEIWKIQDRSIDKDGNRVGNPPVSPYIVRWRVGKIEFNKAHERLTGKSGADAFRALLITARNDNERFSKSTGEPLSWQRCEDAFAAFVRRYVFDEWPKWLPNTRRTAVEGLERAIVGFVRRGTLAPPAGMRGYLRDHWLNPNSDGSADDETCQKWVTKWSPMMDDIDRKLAAEGWDKLTYGDDGQLYAAATSGRRQRAVRTCFNWGVRLDIIGSSPLPVPDRSLKSKSREKTAKRVRPEVLPNEIQTCETLAALINHQPRSWVLYGFLGTIFHCGTRPFETAGLGPDDIDLPASGWGTLWVCGGIPQVAERWFNEDEEIRTGPKGQAFDHPGREVPIPPWWVPELRNVLDRCPSVGGVLFTTRNGTPPTTNNIWRAWTAAKERTLAPRVPRKIGSKAMMTNPLLATRVYDLRHACASNMMNAGVPLPEIAARLGHSVEMLMSTYAHCIVGGKEAANAILEAKLGTGRLLSAERVAHNLAENSTGEPRETTLTDSGGATKLTA
jgi:integrase